MSNDALLSERERRWRLALGPGPDEKTSRLNDRDARLDQALTALYGTGDDDAARKGTLGASSVRIARWLGDIREFFQTETVRVIQQDAIDRLGMAALLADPNTLSELEPDVGLVAEIMALSRAMPNKTKAAARLVVETVVAALIEKLEQRTQAAVTGALNRSKRTQRPKPLEIDWPRTIRANLTTWSETHRTIVPERLVGQARTRRQALTDVILCVDQSGSMAQSVVYASVFAAVMASLPSVSTRLIAFDTAVADLSDLLRDPVDVLFGVQLGGGTDIGAALSYASSLVSRPEDTTLVLISDLYEGGDPAVMLHRLALLKQTGVRVIVLLALNDDGRPGYAQEHAVKVAALDIPAFACTPQQFPDLMAVCLRGEDIASWAASEGIAVVQQGNGGTDR
ncbi:MAG: VWA domain-containing protein [Pseudomonadota bacterium]